MNEKRKTIRNKYVQFMLKSKRVSEGFANSWYSHCRMFGEVLEPAFAEDEASRLELTAALNLLSSGKYVAALKKLEKLYDACECDDDLIAWNFFMGVCFEKSGMAEFAVMHYGEAAQLGASFYMVYLLPAKIFHAKKRYEAAANAYIKTLEAVQESPRQDKVPVVKEDQLLGSVHGNLAGCLVMMRRYDDAEYELYEAERYGYKHQQLTLTWATLYAATDRKKQAGEKMDELKKSSPELESASVLAIEEIIQQKNSRFSLKSIPTEKLAGFWRWFTENERRVISLADGTGSVPIVDEVYEQVCNVFDFGVEKPGFDFGRDGEKARLSFFDNYNLTFEIWLGRLVDTAPKSLLERWSFYAVH